jgi:hypothetical protein
MNNPSPTPQPHDPQKPVVVVPKYTRADVIRMIVIAVAVLGSIAVLLILGMKHIKKSSGRLPLTGTIVSHYKTGVRETELNVSRRGVQKEIVDTGFYLKVRVGGEDRIYDVMVDQTTWDAKKDGDTIIFHRPETERRF